MTVAEILAGGVRLLRTQRRAVAIWGLVYLGMTAVMVAAMWPMFGSLAAFQAQAIAAQTGQAAPPEFPVGFFGTIVLVNVVMVLGLAVIFAAAVRAVARGGDDRYGFLRIGMDEARLIGLAILLVLIGFVAMLALILVVALIGVAVAAIAGVGGVENGGGASPSMLGLIAALYLGLIVLMVWAQTRISLAGALTVLRGRIVIREAWRATAGRFWPLFGAYLVIGLTFVVISIVASLALNPDMFAAMTATTDPAAAEAAMARQMEGMFGPRWLALVAVGTVLNVAITAFAFGAIATAALAADRADH